MTRQAADAMGSVALMFRHSISYMTDTTGSRGQNGLVMHAGMVSKLCVAICTVDRVPCYSLIDGSLYGSLGTTMTSVAIETFFGMLINNIGPQAKVGQMADGTVC
jgi:hypothetical protein